jgi:SAM-dependent methyltransferase
MRFDTCAHSYHDHALPQREFAACVAEFIGLRPGDEALELGAGTGALTSFLCAGRRNVRATDASPAMVALGRASVPQAHWFRLDAFQPGIPIAALQVSSGLLQWADEPVRVLRHWKAALRPGGRMVHAMPCEPCLREWRALVPENPLPWRDENQWRVLFAEAGLRVSRQQLWIRREVLPSALDLLRGFHRTGVTGRPVLGPGRLRQALRLYDAQHRTPDGVAATWAWLAIEAMPESPDML